MTAQVADIYIEQGATFLLSCQLFDPLYDDDGNLVLDEDGNIQPGEPRDLTGCWARMQIRPRPKSATAYVTATSKELADDPLAGGRIILGPDGHLDIELTDLDTMAITREEVVYDLELVNPDAGRLRPFVERVLQGAVTCNLNVTRSPEDDQ